MSVTGRMLRRSALGLAVVLLVAGVVFGNVYVTNTLIREDKEAVTITPTAPLKGERGERGEQGRAPTQEEIKQAVADYCATSGLCEGRTPSQAVVFAAVSQYCQDRNCRGADGVAGAAGTSGRDGADGKDAPAVTDAQIQAQVVEYCADNGCAGEPGTDGVNGLNGRTPILACVVRSGNPLDERYIAWKYDDEASAAYRNLYRVNQPSTCENEVDLRTN